MVTYIGRGDYGGADNQMVVGATSNYGGWGGNDDGGQ